MRSILVEGRIIKTIVTSESLAAFRAATGAEVAVGNVMLGASVFGLPGDPDPARGLFLGFVGPYSTTAEAKEKGEGILAARISAAVHLAGIIYDGAIEPLAGDRLAEVCKTHKVGIPVDDGLPDSPAPAGTAVH